MAESLPSTRDYDQAIDWLVEQRREDHERLQKLARFVEGLGVEVREHAAMLARGAVDPTPEPASESRILEETVRHLIEQVARIDRGFEEHVTNQTRQTQADASQRDRERRAFGEVAQLVEALGRSMEGSTSRIAALAEEIRRERDSRAPLVQGQEEIQRAVAALGSRLSVNDEQIRRSNASQAVVEQGHDRQRNEVNRISGAVQILDLRLTRELAELRQQVEQWRDQAVEQVKPVGGLARQVVTLAEQREAAEQRLVQHQLGLDTLRDELARLEAIVRTDRAAFSRMAEAAESQARRAEDSGGAIWQLGERMNGLADRITLVAKEIESFSRGLDELVRRVSWVDDERRRVEADLTALATTIRAQHTVMVERADRIEGRLAVEVRTLAEQAESRQRLVTEHLRRTVDELALQLAERDSQAG